MICPKCLSEIPNDSSYCDQCGVEILICPSCGKFGIGEFCELDNSKMAVNNHDSIEKSYSEKHPQQKSGDNNFIILKNNNLDINIKITGNGVIGRKSKIGSSELSRFKQISSKHVAVEFKLNEGWFVTDLNTTNGTKINGIALEAMLPAQLKSGDTLTLANIEFFII